MRKRKLKNIFIFFIKIALICLCIKLLLTLWETKHPQSYNEAAFIIKSIEAFSFDSCANGFLSDMFKSTEEVAYEYLSLDPDGYKAFIDDGGSIIVIKPEEMNSIPDMPDDTVGIYESYTNAIYLSDIKNAKSYPVILHELGHFIDSYCGVPSMSPEFITIAQQEIYDFARTQDFVIGSSYILESYQGSRVFQEYYAETYMCYHALPNYLKASAPKTYEYFQKMHKIE